MNYSDKDIINLAWQKISRFKTFGIIASIVIILLGLCLFLHPFRSQAFVIIFFVVVGLIIGIEKVFIYFKTDKLVRDGWTLAIGIMWIICSLVLLSSKVFTIVTMMEIAGTIIGVTAIVDGIGDFINLKFAELMGRSKALMIVSGILDIICGVICISHPISVSMAVTWAEGLFVIILGVTLLIRCLSIKKTDIL